MIIEINNNDFVELRDFMFKKTGVFLKDTKKPLVVARLRSRLEKLACKNFKEYLAIIQKDSSNEIEFFINTLTTNETYFYRHGKQFDYLANIVLPALKEKGDKIFRKNLTIWCAASSTGEEPYSLAIACMEFFNQFPGWKFKILASDINTDVLDAAREGIFSERSLKELSDEMKKRYFSAGFFDNKKRWTQYKITDEVKRHVTYSQHNLLSQYHVKDIDIIFIRNVMIYFNKDSKQKVMSNVFSNLRAGGYLFISLSETLTDVKVPLVSVAPGIYKKE